MTRTIKISLILFLTAALVLGCGDFLTGPKIDTDPNRVTHVSADQLFNAVQISGFVFQEGHIARTVAIWMQQMAGTDRQYAGIGQYLFTETSHNLQMIYLYAGGGLVDIRQIRKEAEEKGWRVYASIVKTWEALNMGTAASLWGDLPYSEAVSDVATPRLDPQKDIYDALQALLDSAIADLQTGQGYIPPNDHVYGGNPGLWIAAANALKARLYLHWRDYPRALNAARRGISSPAGDFKSKHTTAEVESNVWYQFDRSRNTYQRAGKYLVDLLKARKDPRLPLYFAPTSKGEFVGAAPGEANPAASNLSGLFLARDRSSDILTHEETQLIWAECAFQTGDESTALAKLNEVRARMEIKWNLPGGSLPALRGLSGRKLLEAIMEEKYIALFLNIEAWNDWKRTDLPSLTQGQAIPRRLYYGLDERNTNPNVPPPDQQPKRNPNDSGGAGS